MHEIERYRALTSKTERQILQMAVVSTYGPAVDDLVAKVVPAEHREEATAAGLLGLLIALEKYDPTAGVPFEATAMHWAQYELGRWLEALAQTS
jgi:DNA-directed RNA polymerase specialized sigma subunit